MASRSRASDVFFGKGGDLPPATGWRRSADLNSPAAVSRSSGRQGVASAVVSSDVPRAPTGTVLAVEQVGPSVRVFRLSRDRAFEFRAGQHVKLGLASLAARPYSIASAPSDADMEFCVRLVPGGRLTPSLFSLVVGAQLRVSRPKGKFSLDTDASLHVMVATGTGIAPFRSMLRESLAAGSTQQRFVLVHGASDVNGLPFREELTQLAETTDALSYVPTVSRPTSPRSAHWRGQTGRADEVFESLAETLDLSGRSSIYACGHAGMIENVRHWCQQRSRGVRAEKFY